VLGLLIEPMVRRSARAALVRLKALLERPTEGPWAAV
jgi:hypothetical protein